jgi:hypothetical protein
MRPFNKNCRTNNLYYKYIVKDKDISFNLFISAYYFYIMLEIEDNYFF